MLVDAGPLVALIHADDRHHASCRDALEQIRESLATVWPVITEAMYLLDFSRQAQDALWRLLERDAVKILPLDAADVPRMRELMRKYRDLPMDLADAALVRVAERERVSRVFTIDRRDFEVYRPRGIRRFTILP
ncbi:MAG TPA: PIN domain-containing protein [Thermoanaerobaculia bacterium]